MAKKLVRSFYFVTVLSILLAQVGLVSVAADANFTVNSTADAVDANPGDGICETVTEGQCTLRAAVQEANALAGADTITIPAGTYTFTIPGTGENASATGDLDVIGELEIVGSGAGTTIIDAGDLDRVFHIEAESSLTASGITIRNGNLDAGAGVLVEGTFVLEDGVIADNSASSGGGVFSTGFTTINRSLIINNTSIPDDGGGLFAANGSLTLKNSTVANNNATGIGGGLVTTAGGGAPQVSINNVTFAGNSASNGGGIFFWSGTMSLQNTIVANSAGGGNCSGVQQINSLGNNLSSDGTCNFNASGDLLNTNPLLDPLSDNGGSSETMALQPGSPAIDAGNNADCEATDQRGVSRPQGDACDIGAFEVETEVEGPDILLVTNTNDSGAGSLRQAILEANAAPNSVDGPDEIHFDIPGAGVKTISPGSALPAITDPVILDGYTQPGASANTQTPGSDATLLIQLSGSNAPGAVALDLDNGSDGSTIRGLVINDGFGIGIWVHAGADGAVLQGNYIGTNTAGTVAVPNGSYGLYQAGILVDASPNTQIGGTDPADRNVIAGNQGDGIALWNAGVVGTVIEGNYIGVGADGETALPNGGSGGSFGTEGGGVTLRNFISGTVIGGAAPGAGNIISNNAPYGVVDYSGNNTTLQGNTITNQANIGVFLNGTQHTIEDNVIASNSGPGVAIFTGNTSVRANSIYDNTGPDIDLGGDGVTFNHAGVISGPNNYQNYPVLTVSASDGDETRVVGTLISDANQSYTIDVFSNEICHPSFFGGGENYLGSFNLTTDASGLASFDETMSAGVSELAGITATATGPNGTSEFSYCRPASTTNLNWVQAQAVSSGSQTQQFITDRFQEKWFKFPVGSGSQVQITLTSLPGSAVSLHRDPFPVYNALVNPQNAAVLSAEASNAAFLPSGSLPSGSLPSGSLPSGSLPSGSLPSGSLPTGYLPSGSLPSGSLPSGSLPSGSLPSGSLPSGSLPSGSLPSGSLPSGSLPSGSLPSGSLPSGSLPSGSLPSGSLPSGSLPSGSLDAYASAARFSLLGISMDPYATVQTIERNTYDLQEDLYVRVVGPYDLETPFILEVNVQGGVCGGVQPVPNGLTVISGPGPASSSYQSLILTDSGRLNGTSTEIANALADLEALAARSDVNGIVIDLNDSQYERVAFANTEADQTLGCAFAKNTVANEIKRVIEAYRAANPNMEYIVLAGGADVIPFFQVPDVSGLANEKEYIVPVAPSTASEAGLRTNLVQGQDGYGSQVEITQAGHTLSLPDLAVGRLVDSASDISAAVDAYILTGGVIVPNAALVTGYDFVGDAAVAIQAEMEAGTNSSADTLIQPPGEPPTGPNAWTADDLRAKLFAGSFDIAMLTGHFSAGNLLAADYTSVLSASEVAGSSADLTDVLVLALGCHGGYTIPGSDLLTGASPDPDWAKAFLRKGAAGFISATGYAYGDTELTEYGERLFLLMAQQLRTGTGPVPVGQAIVKAKQQYLAETAQLTGIDHKTIVEMALYGLPMMKVDMPGARLTPPSGGSIVSGTDPVTSGPGASVGLSSAGVALNPAVTTNTKQLQNLSTGSNITTTYLSGPDGVVANPFEPIYPKAIYNVNASGSILRGVALRGGSYTDLTGIIPLTASPTTETSTTHLSYNTEVFYPTQTWMANYFNLLSGGDTRLIVFPAQFQSSAPGAIDGTLRRFDQLDLQLYYLPASWAGAGSPAATKAAGVSAAPVIQGASAVEDGSDVIFSVNAVAEGSAGVQAVWVLYTGKAGSSAHGTWFPLDLVRSSEDPTLWEGTLALPSGLTASDLLFMVQAVGGAGLTTLSTNLGAYYSVTPENASQLPPPAETVISLQSPPSSGTYLKESTFTLSLTSNGQPLPGQLVSLDIGGQQALATTDSSGEATIDLRLVIPPGDYTVQARFRGNAQYLGSNDVSPFTVNKDSTTLTVTPSSATVLATQPTPFVAVVRDSSGRALGGKSVFFVVHNSTHTYATSVIADFQGNASLGAVPLPAGAYTVDAYFGGTIPTNPALTLSDDYYLSSSRLGLSLTIEIFNFTGFFAPVQNPPVMNQVNSGRAIPIKFSLNGDQGLNIFANGYPRSQQVQCDGLAPTGSVQGTMTVGSSSLSYDPTTEQYTYVWSTERSWRETCRQFIMVLIDGQTYTLNFQFVR